MKRTIAFKESEEVVDVDVEVDITPKKQEENI